MLNNLTLDFIDRLTFIFSYLTFFLYFYVVLQEMFIYLLQTLPVNVLFYRKPNSRK